MEATHYRWSAVLAGTVLVLLLAAGLPLFVCMPPWADVTFYDLCARNILRGGVHYRDVFDTNLPGMVWLHAVVRSLLGWSSEAIRLVDVGVLAAVTWMLARWLKAVDVPVAARLWTAAAVFAFTFSTTEGNHCQRDLWMLLPAVGGLFLRHRQIERMRGSTVPSRRIWMGAAAEGLCWGAAVWIKPHVLVPAAACWLITLLLVPRRSGVLFDALGLFGGGLLAGGLGIIWLIQTETWPHFVEVFLHWDPEYLAQRMRWKTQAVFLLGRFKPWGLVHLVAIPFAVGALWCWRTVPARRVLFAALYLGWLAQAGFLQKNHEYVHVPAVLLAVVLVAEHLGRMRCGLPERLGFAGLAVYLAVGHPLLRPERLALWGRCWREGSTAELRDRLRLTGGPLTTDWADLGRVADYLHGLGLRDGELTCYNNFTHPLLLDLDLRPSVRILHFDVILSAFPNRREQIRCELATSGQRYVVSDLGAAPAACARLYPWNEPVVFQAGRYAVHRVTGPVGPLVPEALPRASTKHR